MIGALPAAAAEIKEFFTPKAIFRKFIEELIKEKVNSSIISSLEYLKMIKEFWPDIPHRIKCYAGRFYCEITPEGFVVPCCANLDMANDNCRGLNIGFQKAFFQLNDMSECRDCYYAGPQELNIILETPLFKLLTLYKTFLRDK
jgi:MoaA/NifB/PqqE/SkfB family radical SAM enzyme